MVNDTDLKRQMLHVFLMQNCPSLPVSTRVIWTRKGDGTIIFQENKVGWEQSTNSVQGVTLKMAKSCLGCNAVKFKMAPKCYLLTSDGSEALVVLLTCAAPGFEAWWRQGCVLSALRPKLIRKSTCMWDWLRRKKQRHAVEMDLYYLCLDKCIIIQSNLMSNICGSWVTVLNRTKVQNII